MIGSGDCLQLSPVLNILYGDFGTLCIESQVFNKKSFTHHINLTVLVSFNVNDVSGSQVSTWCQ